MTDQKCLDYEWELYCSKHSIEDTKANHNKWLDEIKLAEYEPYVVGFRLRFERRKSGLTQEEVASAMGINTCTLSCWENGQNNISLRDAHRLMQLYQRFPGNRADWDKANLGTIVGVPMVL